MQPKLFINWLDPMIIPLLSHLLSWVLREIERRWIKPLSHSLYSVDDVIIFNTLERSVIIKPIGKNFRTERYHGEPCLLSTIFSSTYYVRRWNTASRL